MSDSDTTSSEGTARAKESQAKEPKGAAARKRRVRPFPGLPIETALDVAKAIQEFGAGARVRRLTLFDRMGREAASNHSRLLVVSSRQYGLTTGSYDAEYLELTDVGRRATSPDASQADIMQARFEASVSSNPWQKKIYDRYVNNRLPAPQIIADQLQDDGLDPDYTNECVELFTDNARFLGILRPMAGAERLITIEHAIEEEAAAGPDQPLRTTPPPQVSPQPVALESGGIQPAAAALPPTSVSSDNRTVAVAGAGAVPMSQVCFYIAPIGDEASEFRQHSDLFMGSLVEPALTESGLTLVRADQMGEPGLITKQVIECIVGARLVIADLSFHNPNVFYELALRHAVRKPVVQLIRGADRIPFDIRGFRTIQIDTSSIYTLVPQLDSYRNAISSQIRTALEVGDEGDNPLTLFYPQFWGQSPQA